MRKLKLSGREAAVVRSIDFTDYTAGKEIKDRTHMEIEDLVDVVNGLMDAGFVETNPPSEVVIIEKFEATMFEVNPAYAQELRIATRR